MNKKEFLAQTRRESTPLERQKHKVVNTRLEALLNRMLTEAADIKSAYSFDEKATVIKLALQLEAVRTRIVDDDWGKGFFGAGLEVSDTIETQAPEDEQH